VIQKCVPYFSHLWMLLETLHFRMWVCLFKKKWKFFNIFKDNNSKECR